MTDTPPSLTAEPGTGANDAVTEPAAIGTVAHTPPNNEPSDQEAMADVAPSLTAESGTNTRDAIAENDPCRPSRP
jgi:hypothetical protein